MGLGALQTAPSPPIPGVAHTIPEQQPGTKTIIAKHGA
jgi:hypothetical protein